MRGAAAAVAAVVLLVSGCGDDGDDAGREAGPEYSTTPLTPTTRSSPPSPANPSAGGTPTTGAPGDTTAQSTGTVVVSGPSDYGEMLFDERGQAIYLFEPESDGTPRCYDECADAWPPVLTDGAPVAEGAVQSALLGTVERDDGSTQVTYDGWPLYFYANEEPGQVLCHNIVLNGGLWLVLGPDGEPGPT